MKKFLNEKRKDEEGQSMVEFALILPIFLLILCGIIDFGWMFYNQLALNNICREGARYAVVNTAPDHTTDEILRHIDNYIDSTYALGELDVEVKYTTPTNPVGGDVSVSVKEDFSYLTPIISTVTGKQSRPLTAEVIMRVES